MVFPFLLTATLLLLHRTFLSGRTSFPIVPGQLLLLSTIAIWSHPVLDTLNTYGVRWLMPFSGTWYYGDTLFIVDPWIWAALGIGVSLSWRREVSGGLRPGRPAGVALALVVLYLVAMAGSGAAAGSVIRREVETLSGQPVKRMMAGPVAVNPLARRFVAEQETGYLVGRFDWLKQPRLNPGMRFFEEGPVSHPAVLQAAKTVEGRRFLSWARFPVSRIEQLGAGRFMVHLIDVRYAETPVASFGTVSVPVALQDTSLIRK